MQITIWDVNYFLMFILNCVSWRNEKIFPSCSALVCYLHCSISALEDWVSWFCFLLLCFAIPFSPSFFSSEICYPCWAPHTNLLSHLIFLTPNLGLFLAVDNNTIVIFAVIFIYSLPEIIQFLNIDCVSGFGLGLHTQTGIIESLLSGSSESIQWVGQTNKHKMCVYPPDVGKEEQRYINGDMSEDLRL